MGIHKITKAGRDQYFESAAPFNVLIGGAITWR